MQILRRFGPTHRGGRCPTVSNEWNDGRRLALIFCPSPLLRAVEKAPMPLTIDRRVNGHAQARGTPGAGASKQPAVDSSAQSGDPELRQRATISPGAFL